MTVFHAQANKNGELVYGPKAERLLREVAKRNPGKIFKTELDDRPTLEMIRFFHIVVLYFLYQHEPGVFQNFDEARESIKLQYNPKTAINEEGERVVVGGSMTDVFKSKRKTHAMLERVERGFMENGYEYPDSEAFHEWLLTIPGPEEVYPPLQRLIDRFNSKK